MMSTDELTTIQYNLKQLPGPWWVEYAKGEEAITWGDKADRCEECHKEGGCCQSLAYGEYQVSAPGGKVVCWLDSYTEAEGVARLWKDARDLLSEVQLLRGQIAMRDRMDQARVL